LHAGEAIGGYYVFLPEGQAKILVYGSALDLKGNLEPTGTGMDQTLFFTFETAQLISKDSIFLAEKALTIPPGSISSIMVKLDPQADMHQVALQIAAALPGIEPVESTNLFYTHRSRINSLLRGVVVLLGISWLLSVTIIGLVFSMVANERRREIAVLRALGARQVVTLQTLLMEGVILALFGGMAGIGFALSVVYLFKNFLVQWMGVPFLFPSLAGLLLLALAGLGLALLTVVPAALVPTLRISRMEPALAMRN
jgi:putative ABC transport system permease protein